MDRRGKEREERERERGRDRETDTERETEREREKGDGGRYARERNVHCAHSVTVSVKHNTKLS